MRGAQAGHCSNGSLATDPGTEGGGARSSLHPPPTTITLGAMLQSMKLGGIEYLSFSTAGGSSEELREKGERKEELIRNMR